MKYWLLFFLIIAVCLYFWGYMVFNKILNFIELYNPSLAKKIAKAIMKHKDFFPGEFVTALQYGESGFDPNFIGEDLDKGLGQLTEAALKEIERVYGIKVDRTRLLEVDYNTYLTCLFLKICKSRARPYAKERGLYLYYATLLTYKDWLTWTDWTYTKADRTWEVYNQLRWGYQRYGRKVGDVRAA